MPYGHIKQYRDAVEEARKKRILITRQQERQIARLYADVAKDLGREISRKSEKTLTYRWLKDYGKSLKSQSRAIYSALQEVMESSIYSTASLTVDTEMGFWGTIVPELSERFRDTFSSIPQKCVNELMNGGIYKDFTGLSERLWNYKGTFDRDIGYIINRGIIEQKSAFDLAKDLELYLKPEAKKPWEWRKAYPHSSKTVDYSAQRLARTSVTHAYQLSFQRSTVDNPFIERYQWHSSNAGKICELCRQRNGKFFEKDRVPLDHPNGMCFITAEISKNMDEIAEELADWAGGGRNPALDAWLKPKFGLDMKGMKISIPEDVYRKSGITREVRRRIDQSIKTLQEEYVIKLKSIETAPMGKSDMFGSGPYVDADGKLSYGLVINSDMDYNKIMERAQINYEKGRFAGKTIEDYIAHEMAHIMVYQGCETEEEYNSLKKIVTKLYVPGISGYADGIKNGDESLAEAFVRFRNGEEIPLCAKVLITSYIERWKR